MKLTPSLGGAYSGSFGGLTASHNRGGQYLRRRSVPTNPNTVRQQIIRSIFGGLVQSWTSALTEPERQAWRDYAAGTPATDTLGQELILTGQQAYIRSNTARQLAGLAVVEAAPTIFNTGEAPSEITEWSVATGSATLNISGNLAAAASDDGDLLIFIGPPQNPGRTFFKGPYQFAATGAIAATDTTFQEVPTVATEWFSDHTPTDADVGTFWPLRLIIAYDDGRVSQSFAALTELTLGGA
jgi:hypothetical protein